jgi:hypothetical protein
MRRPPKVFLALVTAILAASLPTAVALAQLPQFPNTFFGDATDNDGQPAPVGVVVTAVVDRGVPGSEKRYSLPIAEPGKFGSPTGLKLKVGGDSPEPIADGSVIEFFLSVGALPDDIGGLAPVAETLFADDGNPHNTPLQLAGPILDPSGTPTPVPTDSESTPTPTTDQPRRNDDDDNGSSPLPTSTPQPATPTSPSDGGGGGQPVPTATPGSVPTAEPEEPTPLIVVVGPPQVPTPTEVPSITNIPTQTTEPTPTQQPAATPENPTPTTSLEIDESLTGGGGGDGGFPWWGWVIIVLGAGAVAAGVALYYLRT